jgi:transposase InsO family protein
VEAAQPLDAEMQHVDGPRRLVALQARGRLGDPPMQAQPPQPGTDRRAVPAPAALPVAAARRHAASRRRAAGPLPPGPATAGMAIASGAHRAPAGGTSTSRRRPHAARVRRGLAGPGWYQARGITCQRILTDNGSGYVSCLFPEGCGALGVRHRRTQPYTPRANGKAERFIPDLAA